MNKLHRNSLRLLVSGPYGGLNYGDDAIGKVICSQLRQRGAEVVLAVSNIEDARRIYNDTPLVERLNLRSGRLSSLRAICKCDAVVIRGGEQSCDA